MFKNIFRTFVSRIIIAILTFSVVFLTSRTLGATHYGTIGLILIAISMTHLFASLLGGTALVYYSSRLPVPVLFVLTTLWSFLVSIIVAGIMAISHLYPAEFLYLVIPIGIVSNIMHICLYIILGKERIIEHNIMSLIQIFIHFVLLFTLFYVFDFQNIKYYLLSLLVSYTIAMFVGIWFCRKDIFPLSAYRVIEAAKEIIKYGFWVQMSAFVQIINYRLSYYLIDFFLGRQMLGIFTLCIQIAEGFWILPRSIALVQFSHISNSQNPIHSYQVSLTLMQFTMFAILVLSLPLYLIPESLFLFVFGNSFSGMKSVISWLIPAIIIFSGVIIISHYFSGINKVYYNTITALVGLIFTVSGCLLLIPALELKGAALAAVFSYSAMFIAALLIFLSVSKKRLSDIFYLHFNYKHFFKSLLRL